MGILAALAFLIGLFTYGVHPTTWIFWALIGLILLSIAHLWDFPAVERRRPHG